MKPLMTLLGIMVLTLSVGKAGATDHWVGPGGSYADIQDAIDASTVNTGDTLHVFPGTYTAINLGTKSLDIISTDGPASTTIDAAGTNSAVIIPWGVTATIDGFTITGGNEIAAQGGGGVRCNNADAVIRNAIITGNHTGNGGGGVFLWTCDAELENVVISNNVSGTLNSAWGGGGIMAFSGSNVELTHVTISGNLNGNGTVWGGSGGAIFLKGQSHAWINSSIVWDNFPNEIEMVISDSPS